MRVTAERVECHCLKLASIDEKSKQMGLTMAQQLHVGIECNLATRAMNKQGSLEVVCADV